MLRICEALPPCLLYADATQLQLYLVDHFRPVRGGSWGAGLGLCDSATPGSHVLLVVLSWANYWAASCDLAAGWSWCIVYWLWKLRGTWHRGHEPQYPQLLLGKQALFRMNPFCAACKISHLTALEKFCEQNVSDRISASRGNYVFLCFQWQTFYVAKGIL